MKKILTIAAGLAIMCGTAYAQGYPPQITPGGTMVPGLSNGNPGASFDRMWKPFNNVMGNTQTYHDPHTGYTYNGGNSQHQWIMPGGGRIQTYSSVPPPGALYQLR